MFSRIPKKGLAAAPLPSRGDTPANTWRRFRAARASKRFPAFFGDLSEADWWSACTTDSDSNGG